MDNIYLAFQTLAHNNSTPAIECSDTVVSYQALLQKTNALLSWAAHSAHPRVAISCQKITTDTIALMLALFAVKKSVLLMDARRDAVLNQRLLASAGCDQCVLSDNISALASDHWDNIPLTAARLQDEGYLVATSGTTGTPKLIRGRYLGLCHFIRWQVATFFSTKRRVAQLTHCAFDVIYREIFTTLLSGSTLVLPETDLKYCSGEQMQHWMQEHQIDTLYMVPSVANFWFKTTEQASVTRHPLKTLFFAGEKLTPALIKQAARCFDVQQFVNFYGPSETTLAKYYYPFSLGNLEQYDDIPVGYPLPDTETYLDQQGVIYIHTPYSSLGYVDNHPFIEHNGQSWYKTGDMGYFKDNKLFIQGRIDDQIKINGVRVHLNAIQQLVSQVAGVTEAGLIFQQGKLYAFYCGNASEQHLVSTLKTQLNKEVIPHYFHPLSALPKTHSGKVDRLALIQLLNTQTHTEENDTIFQCWRTVSGYKGPLSDHDSIFNLGGDSLDVAGFAVALSKAMHKTIHYWDIYENPCFYQIKALLAHRQTDQAHTEPEHHRPVTSYPLSPQQRRYKNIYMPHQNSNWCNMVAIWPCRDVSVATLTRALTALVKQYDSLQSYYQGDGIMRLCHLNAADALSPRLVNCQDQQFEQILEQERIRTAESIIDTEAWPLFRVTLVQSSTHQSIVWNIHHLICDGYSQNIIKKTLFGIIGGETMEHSVSSYAHYAMHNPPATEQSKQYWQRLYQSPYHAVTVPTRYPDYAARGYQTQFTIDTIIQNRLQHCAKTQGVTVFSILLSAYCITLHQYYRTNDMVVGTPAYGRNNAQEEQMVGNFISLVTLRSQWPAGSHAHYMAQMHQSLYQAMKHQDYQYDALVQQQQLPFQQDRFPLTTFFISQMSKPQTVSPCIAGQFDHQDLGCNVKFDMMLYIDHYHNQYVWRAQYRRALFSETDQQHFWNQYIQNLTTLVTQSEPPETSTV